MTTVNQLKNKVNDILTKLTLNSAEITKAYSLMKEPLDTTLQNEITNYNSQAQMYDRLFQEKEAELQANGGRKRDQTLQEYCIFFFFISYAIFIVTLTLYAKAFSLTNTLQIFVAGFIGLFPIIGFLIRFG